MYRNVGAIKGKYLPLSADLWIRGKYLPLTAKALPLSADL